MKSEKFEKWFLIAVAVVIFLSIMNSSYGRVLQHSQPEAVGISTEQLSFLDQVIGSAVFEGEIPGAVALVARKGKIVYRKAFGFRAERPALEPMTAKSIFDVASMTKVMVSAPSIMLLVEEGKISLSDEVAEYIPEFNRRGKGKITILHLLTHYSGLRPDLDLKPKWEGYERAIELACRERPVDPPGTRFIYSDINYFVLGDLVRRIAGCPLDEFARDRIFTPLGMNDTGFRPGKEKAKRIVPTGIRNGEVVRGEVHDPTSFRMGGVAGHAGLFTTVDDTAIWAQMILNGGVYEGTRVLSPLTVERMTTPHASRGEADWRGLGFDIQTRFSSARGDLFPVGSFGHTGFTGTSMWIDPLSETIVVLFTNRLHPDRNGNTVSLRQRVASVVAASLVDLPQRRDYRLRVF
jgi:CubicO group peptidase (beta-lactamase class C family)